MSAIVPTIVGTFDVTDSQSRDGPDRRPSSMSRMLIVLLVVGGALTLWMCPFSRPRHGEPPEFNVAKAKADIIAITGAVQNYTMENQGQLPGSLEALIRPDENGLRFLDLESAPLDPWKHPYRYELCAEGPGFRVSSLGADGVLGGDGMDQDLDNITIERDGL